MDEPLRRDRESPEFHLSFVTPQPFNLIGLGIGLPERSVSNQELAETLDTSDEWITARTGIKSRRLLDKDKALSHLAIQAGRQALEASEVSPDSIDLVLVTTCTPDTFMPATACRVAAAGPDKAHRSRPVAGPVEVPARYHAGLRIS